MSKMPDHLSVLIEKSRNIVMSDDQLREQRISFAYGNTHIENSTVTREMVAEAEDRFSREERATERKLAETAILKLMPRCKSLVNAAHLARIKSDAISKHIRIVAEADFGDGLYLVEVEGDCVPADGQSMQIIIVEGETIRFRDDVDV